MRLLKQPLIIGYIVSGIIVGPLFLNLLQESEAIIAFSEMGIAFLLFMVGLHLSPKVIKEVGPVALVTGVGQILFTATIGYFVALWLNFSPLTSVYIAIALTFSSTIIILKLISDKDALNNLYGKVSVGFLLVQDFVAIIILIIVSSIDSGASSNIGLAFLWTLVKGSIILAVFIPLSYYLLPKLEVFLSKSQEFLFLFSVAWGFGLSIVFLFAGFSIEVGALIAGVLLSFAPYSYEVSSKLKPLRDFFLISFFIVLGSQIIFTNVSSLILPTIIFAMLVVVGNPLIVITLMGRMGYSKKTSFMSGLTVAQIGEFSLIFVALGVKVGHISQDILSFITLICLFTIFGCTYLIMYAESIYKRLSRFLTIFERKNIKEKEIPNKVYDYFLFGENRIGFSIMKGFMKSKKNYVIIDYNPERIKSLSKKKINCIYGDASDTEFLDSIGINKAKMIISTIPELGVNRTLINKTKAVNKDAVIIVVATKATEAFKLYKEGADYVIMAQFVGGEHVSEIIDKFHFDKKKYKKENNKNLKLLKERIDWGADKKE